MTAGSDLVFDHLSHNHIEPRAEYQLFLDVILFYLWLYDVGHMVKHHSEKKPAATTIRATLFY